MNHGNVNREYPSLVLKDGQDDDAAAIAAKAAADAKAKEDVSFSENQQTQIQKIFDSRFSKITAKHETEKKALAEENQQLKDRLAALEGDGKEGKEGDDTDPTRKKFKDILATEEQKRKNEELKRTAAEKDRDEARAESTKIRRQVAMQNAAAKQNFFDLEDVMALTDKMVQYSDDLKRHVVIGADGLPKENSKLEPMSLEEFYADFAAKRPYLVKTDAKSGAGSAESNKGTVSFGVVRTKADLTTVAQKVEYIDKFGRPAWEALPLK